MDVSIGEISVPSRAGRFRATSFAIRLPSVCWAPPKFEPLSLNHVELYTSYVTFQMSDFGPIFVETWAERWAVSTWAFQVYQINLGSPKIYVDMIFKTSCGPYGLCTVSTDDKHEPQLFNCSKKQEKKKEKKTGNYDFVPEDKIRGVVTWRESGGSSIGRVKSVHTWAVLVLVRTGINVQFINCGPSRAPELRAV